MIAHSSALRKTFGSGARSVRVRPSFLPSAGIDPYSGRRSLAAEHFGLGTRQRRTRSGRVLRDRGEDSNGAGRRQSVHAGRGRDRAQPDSWIILAGEARRDTFADLVGVMHFPDGVTESVARLSGLEREKISKNPAEAYGSHADCDGYPPDGPVRSDRRSNICASCGA